MSHKPYAESCEQNRHPILRAIAPRLRHCADLLEIGSGTGQHAVYFAPELPRLVWHTSDRAENHPGINAWLNDADLPNVYAPRSLDVLSDPWPERRFDAVFTANTLHIMSEPAVSATFAGVGRMLKRGGEFLVYGPFSYHGRHTSMSNQRFQQWLKDRDPDSGIRDLSWLRDLAEQAGMALRDDLTMPENNRILVFLKRESGQESTT